MQIIRAAIPILTDTGELEKLRALAREQWSDDPCYAELEALFEERAAEILQLPGAQIPLPLDDHDGTETNPDGGQVPRGEAPDRR